MLPLAHLDREFDYLVPREFDEQAQPGVRVRVRFAGRLVDGFLVERIAVSDHPGKLGWLDRVVSAERVLTPEVAALVDAVAARYAGTRADVLRLAIPPRHARVEAEQIPEAPPEAVSLPEASPEAVSLPEASPEKEPPPAPSPGPVGVNGPFRSTESLNGQFTPDQVAEVEVAAWAAYQHGAGFVAAVADGRGPRAVWQALPGDDWPRRLAELAAVVARRGQSAVLVVPDQKDLDRVAAACVDVAGDDLVVPLAAGLGPAMRYRRWLAALRGTARIVVGTRSAVFAPVPDLGLVAVWDDGDDSHAEPRAPYPHTREVALLRGHGTGCAVVLGGHARTAEAQALVDSGWAHDLVAARPQVRARAPQVTALADSDQALARDPGARAARLPAVAFAAAREALSAGAGVLVQVPRRGYVPSLACGKCRTPARCRRCNGPLSLPSAVGPDGAGTPTCRWCGVADAAHRCHACGARSLRAVLVGAGRTAEELGRAFPGVPVHTSGGDAVITTVKSGAALVVSTVGAEPVMPGGYGAALLLDGWALLGRADLRAEEETLRRWMTAGSLVRPASEGGRVVVVADSGLPTVQALVRWDPVGAAQSQLAERAEVRFPPAVHLAAVDGTHAAIEDLLAAAKLPDEVELLGPVPLPPGARLPFAGDGPEPAEVERMLLRAPRGAGGALAAALAQAQAVRGARREQGSVRVQMDPVRIG
ncbi:primosomal protein N' [Rhodococcus spelaei]|uniref:Probable replication restart protein PriA n=1 Tax=Rhodococcus spelaei TaxID=2546320 RepID=A0A541B2G8_9NOCA|nr:primosomal protein N' [Rhodococcus spelaei]TQF66516.1 primosomal protein N' [Rhodococcus spelaei]